MKILFILLALLSVPVWGGEPGFPIKKLDRIQAVKFNDGRFWKADIRISTYSSGVIVFSQNGEEFPVSKNEIRYLVYEDYVIPYAKGEPQPKMGLFRERYVERTANTFLGVGSLSIGIWQYMEYKKLNDIAVNSPNKKERRTAINKTEQARIMALCSSGIGFLFLMFPGDEIVKLKLQDGTLLSLSPSHSQYPEVLLSFNW